MDLEKITNTIKNTLQNLEFEYEIDEKNKCLCLNASGISAKAYDDEICFVAHFYDHGDFGVLYVDFIFDSLQESLGVYRLINHFNQESGFLRAHIEIDENEDEKNYLYLTYHSGYVSEDLAADQIIFAFDELLDEDIEKLLKPITMLTE